MNWNITIVYNLMYHRNYLDLTHNTQNLKDPFSPGPYTVELFNIHISYYYYLKKDGLPRVYLDYFVSSVHTSDPRQAV